MKNIIDMIKKISTKEIEYKKIWEVTVWDKKFQNVDSKKQLNLLKYKKVSAKHLKSLEKRDGDIPLYTAGLFSGKTSLKLSKNFINNDEVITIPDGRANIRYLNGNFVITDHNKLCKSN
ncbi:MAG: hypothetical protein LBD63_03340, partial [Mycoplasmataceae bacterium]|nr:hypothetical protein [Mycoplasmataceae bacterium]